MNNQVESHPNNPDYAQYVEKIEKDGHTIYIVLGRHDLPVNPEVINNPDLLAVVIETGLTSWASAPALAVGAFVDHPQYKYAIAEARKKSVPLVLADPTIKETTYNMENFTNLLKKLMNVAPFLAMLQFELAQTAKSLDEGYNNEQTSISNKMSRRTFLKITAGGTAVLAAKELLDTFAELIKLGDAVLDDNPEHAALIARFFRSLKGSETLSTAFRNLIVAEKINLIIQKNTTDKHSLAIIMGALHESLAYYLNLTSEERLALIRELAPLFYNTGDKASFYTTFGMSYNSASNMWKIDGFNISQELFKIFETLLYD